MNNVMKKAVWIWQNNNNNADEYVKFYDEFNCSNNKITLKISCDSNYSVFLNGKLVAFGQYPDYPHYKVYDEIELDGVINGNNKLVIVAWYYGEDFQTYLKGKAGLIYEISDREKVLCFSGEATLCKIAYDFCSYQKKIITIQLGYSYRYDASQYDGYDSADYLPEGFSSAVEIEDISYSLHKRPCKQLILKETTYAGKTALDKIIYDLGKEQCGFLHIRFKAPLGKVINIAYGQHILDGEVRRVIDNRNFSVELLGNGDWFEYTNTFRRLSGRFLQITSDTDVEIDFIGLKEVYYPVKTIPVNIGNERRQKIYDTSVRTLQLCMHEHYEDTPWREQALYAMDSRNQMLCGYYAFKEYEFARANLLLMSKAQKKDKLLPLCFPAGIDYPIPFFSLAFVIAMNEYGYYSKDGNFLKDNLGLLYDIVEFFLFKRKDNGVIPALKGYWNFYEWSDGLDGREGTYDFIRTSDKVRYDLAINCFTIIALQNIEKIHKRLGLPDKYNNEILSLQKATRESFYDNTQKMFKSYSDCQHYSKLCNALAVLSGCAMELEKEICKKITSSNDMVENTLSMKVFEYDALLKVDNNYKEYILQEIDKVYGYMLDQGATSFWETIKGADDFDGAGSLCHGWSAIPVYYYSILKAERHNQNGGGKSVIDR